jgi:DNA invertase Pin-like site-specific DNA recombinase
LIQERTKAGLAAARARGRRGGRPRLEFEEAKVLAAKKLAKDTSISIDDICLLLRVGSPPV